MELELIMSNPKAMKKYCQGNRDTAKLLAQYALNVIRAGEVLTVSEAAEAYGITARCVQRAIQKGLLGPEEVAEVSSGYLVARTGAERLWGYEKKE